MPVAAPAADSVLRILEYIGRQRRPVAAASLVRDLGISRARVYQLLGILQERGFVVHLSAEHRWAIGVTAHELAVGFHRHDPLASLGRVQLAHLVGRVGESAHLAVLSGTDVLYVVEVSAPRRPSLITDVGVRLPAHITASGRAILSALPREQVRALYPNAETFKTGGRTPRITSPRVLREALQEVRRRGWAEEDGDVTPGLASAAVPVLDHADWPVAGLAVTYPTQDATTMRREDLVAQLHSVATTIGRAFGRPVDA